MNRDFQDLPGAATVPIGNAVLDLRWNDCNSLAFEVDGEYWIKGVRANPSGKIGMAFGTFDLKQIEIVEKDLEPTSIDRYDYHSPWREAFDTAMEQHILSTAKRAVSTPNWADDHFLAMTILSRALMDEIEEFAPKAAADTGRHRTWAEMLDRAFRSLSAIDQSMAMHSHPFEHGSGYLLLRDGNPVPIRHSESSRWKGWLPKYVHVHAQRAYEQAEPGDVVRQATISKNRIVLHRPGGGPERIIDPQDLETVQNTPRP